jgi:hypothetical protein
MERFPQIAQALGLRALDFHKQNRGLWSCFHADDETLLTA